MEQRVGDYVLERELARWGMGAVYLAHHRDVRRQVAIKLLLASAERNLRRRLEELSAWEGTSPWRHLGVHSSRHLQLFSLDVSPAGDQLLAVGQRRGQRRQLTLYDVAVAAPK